MADGETPDNTISDPISTVAVRALCAFCEKRGDLDRRFTPAPTAQQGIAGHARVSSRRPPHYEREITLAGRVEGLLIRGRADGFDPERRCLEEIKTHRGDVSRIPENHRHLHWAQAKVYGALLCLTRGYETIELAIVYLNIDDETETVFQEPFTAAALIEDLTQMAQVYRRWAEQEAAHRRARNAAIESLAFPHAVFNEGQRALATAVYRAATQSQSLLAQAPTGIGKTVGTLYPALKACTRAPIDKLYFLTAKTPGRQVALEALDRIQQPTQPHSYPHSHPLRVLELVSRDKSCVHPDLRCNGQSCPLAKGFYDRLPAARAAAVSSAGDGTSPAAQRPLDQAQLKTIAAEHGICPYYLGQEMIRWSDVVVGDYNYYFDSHAILFGMMVEHEWRVAVLVDEAHNLVDRARDMYTATLDSQALVRARGAAPPVLRSVLDRLQNTLLELARNQAEPYAILDEVPERCGLALSDFIGTAAKLLGETGDEFTPDLQRFFFDAVAFARLIESFGLHSMVDCSVSEGLGAAGSAAMALCIRNIVPAPFTGPRLAAAHGMAAFSATLNPALYYRDLLGLPENTPWLDVPSPFSADQLQVRVARHVSTRYDQRSDSIDPIVKIIRDQLTQEPGNYFAFFSSFDYLEQTLTRLQQRHPELAVWAQARRMDESARSSFLDRFQADGSGVGFAVLGGVFSEGIDLPGKRLIGAFVVTLGIPQVNPINEAMAQRMNTLFGTGYEYTYLYPGLRKVVQAAGRVIRHRDDRGTVILVDRRYTRPDIQALLPSGWQLS